MTAAPQREAVERTSILLVDPDAAETALPGLRGRYEVTSAASEEQAVRALRTFRPSLVVTELALADGDGVSVCRASKACDENPPLVLAMTAAPERVPEVLIAGCDGVLMKPFAPNLLYTRIALLLRQRSKALRERVFWERARSTHLIEQSRTLMAGTNVVCHDACCPSCEQTGIVNFDSAGLRRAWYACLPCGKVWLGPTRARMS
jgi:DNA-binding response OmpR family regulator